jgi:hypothetical protein
VLATLKQDGRLNFFRFETKNILLGRSIRLQYVILQGLSPLLNMAPYSNTRDDATRSSMYHAIDLQYHMNSVVKVVICFIVERRSTSTGNGSVAVDEGRSTPGTLGGGGIRQKSANHRIPEF